MNCMVSVAVGQKAADEEVVFAVRRAGIVATPTPP